MWCVLQVMLAGAVVADFTLRRAHNAAYELTWSHLPICTCQAHSMPDGAMQAY